MFTVIADVPRANFVLPLGTMSIKLPDSQSQTEDTRGREGAGHLFKNGSKRNRSLTMGCCCVAPHPATATTSHTSRCGELACLPANSPHRQPSPLRAAITGRPRMKRPRQLQSGEDGTEHRRVRSLGGGAFSSHVNPPERSGAGGGESGGSAFLKARSGVSDVCL